MPVRYDIASQVPQIQGATLDPMNMMAQLRQQEYQQAQLARMAQSMDVQDLQARIAAGREMRQAEAAQRQAQLFGKQSEEIDQKLQTEKINVYKNMFQNFVNDQKSLDSFVTMMEKDFPQGVAAFKGKKYSDDWKLNLIDPEKAANLKDKWSPVRGAKQEIEYYANQTGTKILSPEQYKAMVEGSAATVETSRGQAGAFAAPVASAAPAAPAAPEGSFGGVPMSAVKQGFSKVESGGNYAAVGPAVKRKDGVDHAYGKYQVMGANIPSWTKQALGKSLTIEEFLADPDAQEKVFEDQFTRNFKKYGTVEDAASVWFSGRPLAQATKAGARDVNISAPEYVQRVVGGMEPVRNVPTAPLTGEHPSLRALTEQPVNAMAPMLPPANAMVAPSPAPIAQPASLPLVPSTAVAPQPQAMPVTAPDDVKQRQEKFIASAPLGQSAKYRGKVDLENMLTNFANELEYLKEQDAVPSTSNTAARNAEISSGASWLGQAYGRITGSPAQSTRDAINSIRQNLVSVLARATGKTAQELNSNFDVKNAMKALGEPNATIESIRATLNNINKTFGTNVDIGGAAAKSETRKQIEASKATAASRNTGKTITRRGTYNGRPVVEYSDGTVDYAD